MFKTDPAEEAESTIYDLEVYPAGKQYICCADCGCIIRQGEEYFETDLGNLCPDCFDTYKAELRRYLNE